MKFYKDYHFYVAISGFIVLIVGLITDYFGVFVDKATLETIISYILSFLIAFNVININVKKDKSQEEIKNDINKTATAIENEFKKKSSENEKNGKIENEDETKDKEIKQKEENKKIN